MKEEARYSKLGKLNCGSDDEKLLSISIFYNMSLSNTKRFLDSVNSIISSRWKCHDIVLVDNGSSDNTFDLLLEHVESVLRDANKRVHIIRIPKNMGFARANKLAYQLISEKYGPYDYLALINNDVKIYPNAFIELIGILRKFERVAGVQGVLKHGSTIDSGPIYWTFGFLLDSRPVVPPIFAPKLLPYPQIVSYIDGAFSIYKVEAIEEVGFFDIDSFMYGDDYVLGAKLWEAGYILLYVPIIVGDHKRGSTRILAMKDFTLWARMNEFRFNKKLPLPLRLINYGTIPFSLIDLSLRITLLKIIKVVRRKRRVSTSPIEGLEGLLAEYEATLQGMINSIFWESPRSFKEYVGPLVMNTYPLTVPLTLDLTVAITRKGIRNTFEYWFERYMLPFFEKLFFNNG